MFVTHDRAFLRKLATRILEIDRGRLFDWSCDYDTFLKRKEAAQAAEEKQEALRQKPHGLTQDLALYTDSWGFIPEQVMTRTHVWHGTDDPVVPVAHARTLIAKLPNVHQHILQNNGHYSVPLNHMDDIFRMLR